MSEIRPAPAPAATAATPATAATATGAAQPAKPSSSSSSSSSSSPSPSPSSSASSLGLSGTGIGVVVAVVAAAAGLLYLGYDQAWLLLLSLPIFFSLRTDTLAFAAAVTVWCFFLVYTLSTSVSYGFILVALPIITVVGNKLYSRHLRNAVRADIHKHREHFFPQTEQVEFLNGILALVWANLSLFISDTVIENTNKALEENCPSALKKIEMKKFDLGRIPPSFRNFRVDRTDDMKYMLDLDLEYRGDIKIGVTATTHVLVPLPLRVSNLQLKASMRVVLQMLPNQFPLVKTVTVQMMEKPFCDVVIAPANVKISVAPGIAQLLRGVIVSNLESMFCPPNQFVVDLEETLGTDPSKAKEKLQEAKEKEGSLFKRSTGAVGSGLSSVGNAGAKAFGAVTGAGANFAKGVGNFVGLGGSKKKADAEPVDGEAAEPQTKEKESHSWFRGSKNKKKSKDKAAEELLTEDGVGIL